MKWPQIVMIILMTINLTVHLTKHGEPRAEYNFLRVLIDLAIINFLLYFGGFYN